MRYFIFTFMLLVSGCRNTESQNLSQREKPPEILQTFFDDGTLQFEIEVIDSIPNGKATSYYPSGNVMARATYRQGVLDGPSIGYYESGQIENILLFSNDTLHGESVYYYENGNIRYKGKFYKGLKVGTHLEYFEEDNRRIKVAREYVLVGNKSILNSSVEYDLQGNVTSSTPILKLTSKNDTLIIEILNKEFQNVHAVVGSYDRFYKLRDVSLDTIKSSDNAFIQVPLNSNDTIRGYVENYEWLTRDRSISRDIYFSFPRDW